MTERYCHTQRAPLHGLLWLVALGAAAGAWLLREETTAWIPLLVVAVVMALAALCFRRLTVRDDGDALVVAFGPLPVFRKRVPYERIHAARASRSRWIDGWGVHWVPGRGWTWNLWGLDCVVMETTDGLLRVGTDDRDGLAAFLQSRLDDRVSLGVGEPRSA